jgi:hypothetical protein
VHIFYLVTKNAMKRFFLLCEIFLLFSSVVIASGSLATGESVQNSSTLTGGVVSGDVVGTGETTVVASG